MRAPQDVLQLGDARLRLRCAPVTELGSEDFRTDVRRLHRTLAVFRAEHGFGRAIAAPQIGVARRIVPLERDGVPQTMDNPEIDERSAETFSLCAHCMSFPGLLARVRRHVSVVVAYQDERGDPQVLRGLSRADSELLQHEIDHLDGILAIDRAAGTVPFVSRRELAEGPDYFLRLADAEPQAVGL
jgi:peptide deformylase